MTAEEAEKIAVAPSADGSATKVTTPPSTGSTGLLAVTVTASGLANAVPMFAVCGVLPATAVKCEALALEGADVDAADAGRSRAGRWRGCPRSMALPASIAGLPGSRAMVWVGPP